MLTNRMPEANRLSRMISTAVVVGLFFAAFTAVASATDYYVRTGGLDDPGHDGLANDDAHAWKTISYAIGREAVNAGDTIHVAAGEYFENVDVDKSITLEGEGADVVTVRVADVRDHVFEVTAGYVNISGFTVMGADWEQVRIYLGSGADQCNISNNTALDNDYGIHLDNSSSDTLTYNIISNNERGIGMYSSSNNTLTGNNASNNDWYGIRLYSSGNIIYHNSLINNTIENAREYSCGTNYWNSSTEGNYYSDYTGNDTNGDGIGDDPHPSPGGSNRDYHPLMNPWHEPQTPGDLNRDGKLTPADAAIALDIAAGSRPCDPTTLTAADVSGDGEVTSLDALTILQAAAGNIDL